GPALHRRGYRLAGVEAPLRENLAAGMLWLLDWPRLARQGWRFLDPMCGSGTLPIEAAMIAADIAPGLLRRRWGFAAWKGHDAEVWHKLVDEARQRQAEGLRSLPPILGRDRDAEAIRAARENARRAGLEGHIGFERGDIGDIGHLSGPGLVAVNPPYGERLEQGHGLARLYGRLGRMLAELPGWHCGVITGEPGLLHRLRLRPQRQWSLYNGALPVRLVSCRVPYPQEAEAGSGAPLPAVDPSLATPFANRLRKNLRHLGKWARREGIDCWRAYDADIPEFALAVDRYQTEDDGLHLVVQEYRPPRTVDAELAEARLQAALGVLPEVFEVDPGQVHLKRRARQKGERQYERTDHTGRFHVVHEGPARLRVNFDDYLDTGLFLDHRITRGMLREQARDKHFLNLFCYTAAATVQAVLGGARESLSVDLSATYLDWAAENLRLNGIEPGKRHRLEQADCLQWLREAERAYRGGFDLVFLDPPTFSNSSRMQGVLDINRDHPQLIRQAMSLLAPEGLLVFSTNSRRFRMDKALQQAFTMKDITRATIPEDFRRNPKIHQCWTIRHRES
ncbi:MAG: bifunctional 23S rRNA (guanine(2069)-N(7))-methyltransferase RlmK/23S rRNA (guanine(2445)-N(2))-methyltransferase RlmL, partial [Gammaproteobacteria bacterium]